MSPLISVAIQLLIAVESGGDRQAFNMKEQAIGVLQIRPIMIDDVNRILGFEKYSHADCWDPTKSIEIAEVYLEHYGTEERLGHKPTLRDMGLLWCAGPDGPNQKRTAAMNRYLGRMAQQGKALAQHVQLELTLKNSNN